MAASDHLSPAQLRAHVQAHMDTLSESYDTPQCAEGECEIASHEYAVKALTDGHQAALHNYWIPEDAPRNISTHFFTGHTVANVQTSRGPYVVDLTHRQYDPKAPYPLVEPQHRFVKRESMKPFTTYSIHKKEKDKDSWYDESVDNPIKR